MPQAPPGQGMFFIFISLEPRIGLGLWSSFRVQINY